MMQKEISIVLPLRAGSSRVLEKNTRPFNSNGKSLFQHKLEQIVKLKEEVFEIIISTNDQKVINQVPDHYIDDKLKIIERPDYLCESTTKVQDLINHIEFITNGKAIFWIHATSPFIDTLDYLAALELYRKVTTEGSNDSVMSVNKIQQFIWDERKKEVINTNRLVNPWPNTQDLEPLYEVNHAFYINSRKNYREHNDRIGKNPALFVCEGLKKIDIDWQEDFITAQHLIQFYENDN
jgi:CMP-N-acetylneuraminic acid synthetase